MSDGQRAYGGVESDHWHEMPVPRIPPARDDEINLFLRPLLKLAGRSFGGEPPNIFKTLARHGKLFVPWLLFAGRLMPGGSLPRTDTELVILRVAYLNRCRYEWDHHVRIGRKAGLSEAEIERVASGSDAGGWAERQAAILAATDELHSDRLIADATWARLSEYLSHTELIELCMLAGHYEMLAGTIQSAGIQPERKLD